MQRSLRNSGDARLKQHEWSDMEFLVHGELAIPADLDADVVEALKAKEGSLGTDLAKRGVFLRQWRVPGRRETWTLWEAADATELQGHLESLPLYPFFNITVHSLADHPRDPKHFASVTP